MKDYCVEVAWSLPDLVKQVRVIMEAGYSPIGGIAIKPGLKEIDHSVYMQAMFKDEK